MQNPKYDQLKQILDFRAGWVERAKQAQRFFHGQFVGEVGFLQRNAEPLPQPACIGLPRPPEQFDLS